jgi:hypothetical protein
MEIENRLESKTVYIAYSGVPDDVKGQGVEQTDGSSFGVISGLSGRTRG